LEPGHVNIDDCCIYLVPFQEIECGAGVIEFLNYAEPTQRRSHGQQLSPFILQNHDGWLARHCFSEAGVRIIEPLAILQPALLAGVTNAFKSMPPSR
jgi:hypothetical protein